MHFHPMKMKLILVSRFCINSTFLDYKICLSFNIYCILPKKIFHINFLYINHYFNFTQKVFYKSFGQFWNDDKNKQKIGKLININYQCAHSGKIEKFCFDVSETKFFLLKRITKLFTGFLSQTFFVK